MRRLEAEGFTNVLTATRQQLDLRDQSEVSHWFKANRPEYVFLVAGTVGGILANSTRPAEFIYDNMMIHGTVVHASHRVRRRKLLYLGSSCIYPRQATQPITEEQLLTGPLEPTNEWYAIAKIAGIKLCQAYRQPVRLRLHLGDADQPLRSERQLRPHVGSHVLPALIRKFHDAKETGATERRDLGNRVSPMREFLHVDDLADACLLLMRALQRRSATSTSAPASTCRSASSPRRSATSSTRRPSCSSTPRSPTARRARCSTSPGCAAPAGSRRSTSTPGSPSTYQWFLEQEAAQHRNARHRPPRCSRYLNGPSMPAWKTIEQAEPEFAQRVQRLFDAGRHKTIATLRTDGSPRVSGIECEFADGELRFGSMTDARKGADLKRDPRFALHGPTFHPEEGKEGEWPGEAKIAGRAIPSNSEATDDATDQPDGEMFVADITEVVITGLNAEATKLVVESWTPERGLRRIERD